MTIAEIHELASAGESETIEFKRTTGQRTDGARTVCGMLNGIGGFVFFGVEDDGRHVGQEVTARTLADLVHELRRIDPQPALTPERVPLDNGREVLAVSVPGRTGGAFTYDGRPYLRQGPVTSVMPQAQYRRLLLEGAHSAHRWEILSASGITLDDLDAAEIVRTIKEAVRRLRLDDPGTSDPEQLLRAMQLIRNDQLVNAAAVLFGRRERLAPLYPQCLLRLARFRGTDKNEFIDNRQEVGNAFDLMMRAQTFLRDHLPVAGRIIPSLFERIDDPLYPPVALREALANAICHRDYTMPGGSVGVAIYDDRLEITSTGALPFGLTPEALLRPHTSQPWNPLIANVFFRRGVIEQWGRGTLKMVELTGRGRPGGSRVRAARRGSGRALLADAVHRANAGCPHGYSVAAADSGDALGHGAGHIGAGIVRGGRRGFHPERARQPAGASQAGPGAGRRPWPRRPLEAGGLTGGPEGTEWNRH